MRSHLDAVLFDIGGTLVDEADPHTPVSRLAAVARPGVPDDLAALVARGLRVGAVTNTAVMSELDIRALLAPVGLDELLEVVVTSAEVGVAKPDPGPILVALERMGLVDPTRVLYVGDRPTDGEAAAAAGLPYVDVGVGTVGQAVASWFDLAAGAPWRRACAGVGPLDDVAADAPPPPPAPLPNPPGSLGRLEALSVQLSAIAGRCPPPAPGPATVVVFAADHGVVDAGVSAWPREVTAAMVANFAAGGAAVCVLAAAEGVEVEVVDVGVATPIPATPRGITTRTVAAGTRDLSRGPAMTTTEVRAALDVGVDAAERAVARGARALLTGEMGIGNTTPSAAIIAAVTGRRAAEVVGRGAGADEETVARKIAVVERAVRRVAADAGAVELLAEVGGLEIAALTGFIVAGAAARVPVVLDGVIAAAAALAACRAVPGLADHLVAGHRSAEPAATVALAHLGLEPLLDLDLRLGEGTGAVLALPLLSQSVQILTAMATFADLDL